jgi:AraC-like DNA-binding protein
MTDPAARQHRMIQLLRQLAPFEGYTLSALEGIKFMRLDRPLARTPVLYEPCIVIVCQGIKRGFLGGHEFIYDARHFLVASVPLPFESETIASAEEPMLAVSLRIDMPLAAELVAALDKSRGETSISAASMCATPLSDKMSDALLRLLEVLMVPGDCAILGPGFVRELLFYVLTGPQGGAIRTALAQHSQFGKIGKALRRIHADYQEQIDVGTLASEAGMSVAAFHANFKSVTQTSPMQYLKSTRLHKARLLMVQDGMSASSASNRVGYESSSQFSREFKRFFGRSPLQEASHMKRTLMQMPAENTSQYVTVQ